MPASSLLGQGSVTVRWQHGLLPVGQLPPHGAQQRGNSVEVRVGPSHADGCFLLSRAKPQSTQGFVGLASWHRRFSSSLTNFVASARRSGGRAKRGSTTSRRAMGEARTKEQSQAIRQWAKANGHELSDRGRIPAHVIEEFEKAHR